MPASHESTGQPPQDATPDLEPLDTDGVGAAVVGTLLFAIAALVLLLFRDALEDQGRGWWIWVAVTAALLGLPGVAYSMRRRAVYRAARESAPTTG